MKQSIIEYVCTIDSGARHEATDDPILLDVYAVWAQTFQGNYVWMVSYFFHNTLAPATDHDFCPDWWPADRDIKKLLVEINDGLRHDIVVGVRPSFIVVTASVE